MTRNRTELHPPSAGDPNASVVCDACKADFEPAPTLTVLPDGSELLELVCPSCSAHYPITTIPAAAIPARDRLARLRNEEAPPELIAEAAEAFRNAVKDNQ